MKDKIQVKFDFTCIFCVIYNLCIITTYYVIENKVWGERFK